MIEQKTMFKIVMIIAMLFLFGCMASIKDVFEGEWNIFDFLKKFIAGIVFGIIATLPYYLILKFVKRD